MNWYLIIVDHIKTSDVRALGSYIPVFGEVEILAKDEATALFIMKHHYQKASLCHVTSDKYDYKDLFMRPTNQFDPILN